MQTVMLEYDLHRELKVKAAMKGVPLQHLVNETLRAALDPAPTPRPIRKKTHARRTPQNVH